MSLAKDEKKLLAELGANLRRERSALGLTQEKLAELANLNIRTVQKIESGKLNILITTAIRLQRSLQCRWECLIPPG